MRVLFRAFVLGVIFFFLTLTLTGCEEQPGYDLSTEQKLQDFEWVLTIFEHNYAPLEMKQKKHKFNYTRLKSKYKQEIRKTKSNQEYIDVVRRFVAEFADAHTHISVQSSSLPGRTIFSYMGFSGYRVGDGLVVSQIFPTIRNKETYPLKEGDYITHVTIKGKKYSLKEYVDKFLVSQVDLGDVEANYTSLFNAIFNRLSTSLGIPEEDGMVLTVQSKVPDFVKETGSKDEAKKIEKEEIWLPFLKRDLVDLKLELSQQKQAEAGQLSLLQNLKLMINGNSMSEFSVTLTDNYGKPFDMNFYKRMLEQKLNPAINNIESLKTFKVRPLLTGWRVNADSDSEEESDSLSKLKSEREVPEYIIPIEEAKIFPAYIRYVDQFDSKGRKRGVKPVGYIRIDTFSPAGEETEVLEQMKKTLDAFEENGVKDVIIDEINNGGGSVSLILRLTQLLTNEKVLNFGIQYSLNQKWLDDIERAMRHAENDTEREIMKRVYNEFEKALKDKSRITDPVSIETLMPFTLEPDKESKRNFNYVLLTNELCASAADMFAQLFKSNGLGVIIGKKTMGAGGNVRQHFSSPLMHFQLTQTESLLVAPEGLYAPKGKPLDEYYIENKGVSPDYEVEVSEDAHNKYKNVIEIAEDVLFNKKKYEAYYKAAKSRKLNAEKIRKLKKACITELIND